ncbi:tigger transposable element-derived protein 4-like [Rhipicephalus sanguineus]|uniref:tigger transposable element-derived protein 4-like n=1 Tax=Rhipicephalus sanguineus TaxID=34632 RepID=UPI0018937D33|nr:tigger transposable element-derived protein 4-like [Rhipicephalus sanguineus]
MSSVPRKRKVLSFEEKFAIVNAVSADEKKKEVAARFNIPASSLSTILSAKDSIREAAESGTGSKKKRLKKSTYTYVDKAVFTWFLDTRARNVPISGAILQQKAKDFASVLGHDNFKARNGWLQGLKSRHGVVGRVSSGESSSADSDASASWVAEKLPGILDRYEAADLYNADETALFYQMLPNRTLELKGHDCRGGK